MDNPQFKKGNLIFLSSMAMDFFYLVECQRETVILARKIDSPPDTPPESLPIEKVVKLAEEQEMLFPSDVSEAISKQRNIIFTPPKKKGEKKPKLMSERAIQQSLKKVSKESHEQLLSILESLGIEDEDETETENGGE